MIRFKHVNEETCIAAGVDPQKLELLCRKMNKVFRELDGMGKGISLFGNSGTLQVVKVRVGDMYYNLADQFSVAANGGDPNNLVTEKGIFLLDVGK